MDAVDIVTPTGGDTIDVIPPYVGSGRYGRPTEISYTDEVAGLVYNMYKGGGKQASKSVNGKPLKHLRKRIL